MKKTSIYGNSYDELIKKYEKIRNKKTLYNWKNTTNYKIKKPSESSILDNYTPEQLLDMLDDKDIEMYLRRKKLKKIQNNIK